MGTSLARVARFDRKRGSQHFRSAESMVVARRLSAGFDLGQYASRLVAPTGGMPGAGGMDCSAASGCWVADLDASA